jgi:integrase/recombinase XerD
MKQAKVLSDKEFKRLLKVVGAGNHASRNRLAVMLSHYAGLRVGEIAHLTWGDVRNTDGSIVDQVHLNPAYTKGGVSRTIFINAKLSKEIKTHLKGLSDLPARLTEPHAPLIRSQKGGAFSPNTLCQTFGELYRHAGIRGASSHSGRRAFITKLAHSGVSAKVIMELAGHKHLTTTQRYIDVNDEMKREAVEILR